MSPSHSGHPVSDVRRMVWTFVLGPFSGRRQMPVRPEIGGGSVSAPMCADFPVARMTVTVEGRPYRVYFDCGHHEHSFVKQVEEDITNTTYVFLYLLHKTSAIYFSVECDFPNILRLLTT